METYQSNLARRRALSLLLKALVLLVERGYPPERKNIGEVYRLLTHCTEKELNGMFDLLPPNHPAKAPFAIFRQASDTVRSGVIIGLGSRLQVFQNRAICNMTAFDEIDLELPGQKPCAYFLITSDQDSTFDFLSSLFLSFVFIKLVRYADQKCPGGKLPIPVHVLGEELTACGVIPDLSRKISVIRSRNLSMSCVFQNLAGLQNRYPNNQWQEILGNSDVSLFLGCVDELTASYISERSGEISVHVESKAKQLGIWRKAYRTGVIERNPMDRVERPKPRKEEKRKKEPDTCSIEEVKYIWDCLEQESLMWRTLIHLLIDTGMRRGECCGLMWKNIDFKTGTITICQTVNYTVAKGVYVDTTKNGKTWTVDVAPYVLDLLRQLRLEQGRTIGFSQFVFTKHNSTDPMHPQSPTGHLKKFEEKYGIKGLHPHKLRHSFASIAITSGADVASVSEILGHSDKAVTLRMYTHADEASKKRASNIFRNALNNTKPDYAKNA